jgi:phosphoenolpyruvate carboxykinase (GTP)
VPTPDSLDVDGLDLTPEALARALAVDAEEWKAEIPQITEWFEKFGDKLPGMLWTELDSLKVRLGLI